MEKPVLKLEKVIPKAWLDKTGFNPNSSKDAELPSNAIDEDDNDKESSDEGDRLSD